MKLPIFKRDITKIIDQRLHESRHFIQVIVGPRQVGKTTAIQQVLESAFLIRGLPKWAGGALRRRSSSPKWLPLNTALMTALANQSFQEWRSKPDLWGRLVEVAVGAYLANEVARHGFEIYYWRKGNYEVDFVIVKQRKIVAIEVKSGKRRMNLSGLKLFTKEYKTFRVLTMGSSGIAIKNFLETPVPEWFK